VIAIDTSAIVAIAQEAEDEQPLRDAIAGSRCVIGAPSLLEVKMVLTSVADEDSVERLLQRIGVGRHIEPVDFTPAMTDAAARAFRAFGKGQGHPAQLNFGDCMSYAVAKVRDVPLLYKGSDFAQTDIVSALS